MSCVAFTLLISFIHFPEYFSNCGNNRLCKIVKFWKKYIGHYIISFSIHIIVKLYFIDKDKIEDSVSVCSVMIFQHFNFI